MLNTYDILLAGKPVAVSEAATPQMALIDHLRMAGCRDQDIVRLGTHSVSWRGAVYRARLSKADAADTGSPADR